jgi:hypothetical protein
VPALPLTLPISLDETELPVRDASDVRAQLPERVRRAEPSKAPVREALVAGIVGHQQAHQRRAAYCAQQSDPTRSTGIYQDGHGEDRGVVRSKGESHEAYRARMFAAPELVSPQAIVDAANRVLAGHTTRSVQFFEGLDRMFVGAGSRPYAFVGTGAHSIEPEYDDRHYPDRDGFRPGGCRIFADSVNGRQFVLRVPILAGQRAAFSYVSAAGLPPSAKPLFIGTARPTFITSAATSVLSLYQAVVDAVNAVVGQGVRWTLISEPTV